MSLLRKGAEAGVQVWRVVWPVTQGVKSRLGMDVEMTEGCPRETQASQNAHDRVAHYQQALVNKRGIFVYLAAIAPTIHSNSLS
jgi:hypothetical protein